MKSKLFGLLLLSSCLAVPLTAVAQTVPADGATATETSGVGVEAMVEKVNILTRSKAPAVLAENEPVALDLGLVDVPGASKELTKGVTAKAYARYVSVEGRKIGQLVLASVEKDGKSEALNSNDFVAQFDLAEPTLSTENPISVEGDQAALLAALERLAEEDEEKEVQEKEVPEEAGTGASDGKVASNSPSNPDASGYSTPSALEVAEQPTVVSNITTDGCNMRIDLDQLQAIQQTRVVTTTDGSPEYGECADGDQRFKIDQSYSACPYDENTETMKATAYFIYYYNDASGNRQEHGECQPDPEKVFDIVEDTDACRVILDYNKLEAVTYAKLVYTNHNGKAEVVRDCLPSDQVEPAVMTPTTEGCDIRDDFAANKSFQRGKYIYEVNGAPFATACTDNGTEYLHETVYKTASGENICQPIVNHDTHKVTLQSRVQIEVNGLKLYRTACTPDTSAKDMASTIEGCDDPTAWTHKLSASQSFGSERFFYIYEGEKEYVTGCQDSATVYPHHVETVGWQPHDDQLFAYPLTTVYIENTPVGRHNILTSQVLDGASQTPYTYLDQVVAETGETTYEGCDKFANAEEVERYERPDGTIHKEVIGEAAPLERGNACQPTVTWDEANPRYATSAGYVGDRYTNGGPWMRLFRCYTYRYVDATYTLKREDGEIIQTDVKTGSAGASSGNYETWDWGNSASGLASQHCPGKFPAYPSAIPGSTRQDLIAAWGWS